MNILKASRAINPSKINLSAEMLHFYFRGQGSTQPPPQPAPCWGHAWELPPGRGHCGKRHPQPKWGQGVLRECPPRGATPGGSAWGTHGCPVARRAGAVGAPGGQGEAGAGRGAIPGLGSKKRIPGRGGSRTGAASPARGPAAPGRGDLRSACGAGEAAALKLRGVSSPAARPRRLKRLLSLHFT